MILHRTRFLILLVLLPVFAFGFWCLYGFVALLGVEGPSYAVSANENGYEIRSYGELNVASTTVNGEFDEALEEGFSRLFSYISGENGTQKSIAMTAPVLLEAARDGQFETSSYRISFVMPSEESMATLPLPSDSTVRVQLVPARLVAVLSFYGAVEAETFEEKEAWLRDVLEKNGYQPDGSGVLAQYSPPFTPWFLRKNEVWIPLLRTR